MHVCVSLHVEEAFISSLAALHEMRALIRFEWHLMKVKWVYTSVRFLVRMCRRGIMCVRGSSAVHLGLL